MERKKKEKMKIILGENRCRSYNKLTYHQDNKKHDIGVAWYATQSAITLIALIVTIIIMLILVGIVLSLTLGEHGIIKKAEQSGLAYEEAGAREKLEVVLLDMRGR